MKRLVLVAALLFAAAPAGAAQRVVVLESEPTADIAWSSGERAVVAELMASDVELVLRPTQASTVAALEREVLEAAGEGDTAGAVAVGREGSRGFALVVPHPGRAPVRIEDDLRQGPVAEGAVALRVSEVLRVRTFAIPAEKTKRETPRVPDEAPRAPLWPWISIAGVAARGAASPAPAMAIGLRLPIHPWVALEPSGAFTLGGLRVETPAGKLSLSARQATLEVVVAPADRRGLSAGVGAGGGVAWLSGVPSPNGGYVGAERSTEVSLLALRGFAAWQERHLRIFVFAELSALLPAVTVRAAGAELVRVGQPWLMSGVALGYSP